MPDESERHSRPGVQEPLQSRTPQEQADIEAAKGLRQFDRMAELIEQATGKGPRFRLRPSTLQDLNRYAVEGLVERPGAWRSISLQWLHPHKSASLGA